MNEFHYRIYLSKKIKTNNKVLASKKHTNWEHSEPVPYKITSRPLLPNDMQALVD